MSTSRRFRLKSSAILLLGTTLLFSPPTEKAHSQSYCAVECVMGDTCNPLELYSFCMTMCGENWNSAFCVAAPDGCEQWQLGYACGWEI